MAEIKGAEAALVCASGMAAIASTVLALVGQGDHLVISEGLYGKTTTLVAREMVRFGVAHDRFDPAHPEQLANLITAHTRLVLVETLSNPLLRVADLESIARVSREAGVPMMVDQTFAPLLCRPLALGATFVMHSVTKLIGGHSDLTQGVVAGPRDRIDRIQAVASTFGQTGNPFESWLASAAWPPSASDQTAPAPRPSSWRTASRAIRGSPGVYPGSPLASRFRGGPPPAQGRLRRHGCLRRRCRTRPIA